MATKEFATPFGQTYSIRISEPGREGDISQATAQMRVAYDDPPAYVGLARWKAIVKHFSQDEITEGDIEYAY